MNEDFSCKSCKFQTQLIWYFCPNCGKILKEKPIIISIGKQLLIYLVSFFLSPMGLIWGIKYLKNPNVQVKFVGIISILLTVVSIGLMLLSIKNFIYQYGPLLNTIIVPNLF